MTEHNYWGKVENSWAGFSSEFNFNIPYFNNYKKGKEIEVFLGSELDEDCEEIETAPTKDDLIEYEKTFKSFLENIDNVIDLIKESAFEYYKERYAKTYEKEFSCGQYPLDDDVFERNKNEGEMHEPLNINDKETHYQYMTDLNFIRIVKGNRIVLPIHYQLDVEHKLEILLKDNKVKEIDGMSETRYWRNEDTEI
jgi:hypothetical protein